MLGDHGFQGARRAALQTNLAQDSGAAMTKEGIMPHAPRIPAYSSSTSFFTATTSNSCRAGLPLTGALGGPMGRLPQASSSGEIGNSLSICSRSTRLSSSAGEAGRLKRRMETPRAPMAQKALPAVARPFLLRNPRKLIVNLSRQRSVNRPFSPRSRGKAKASSPWTAWSELWPMSI